ncbi:MAG TPA: saccharopine dehydrogenase C-terminal domain-containing protein [Methanothrix sp.]|uniref:saccharopine dehydrogenase family protein n=1 Tax=Methanothrix sp. TaxID=90426 RepID=UPI002C925BE3|nr:saccharopine dehydrogenase C-terminal domain-containing protein [Methanothrix sp.]MDI9418523.1 saccharopine dehydrogenase C-terminal domain-containing protein [Euryarchaeota archaeon]HON35449.1 saccharopine dehydrogenase C-terminal domain-containing protein [Methanothrix sp.]HRU74807.1 saccharopine dehydrogenase C-terminal domain-containing protein [Methanothrix sp.]
MKALVLGGTGRIGSAVAWDLARYGGVDEVGIVGRSRSSLQKALEWIGGERVVAHSIDISDSRESRRLMQKYDIGIIALPERKSSYKAVETAIGAGLDAVDILEEYHRRPDPYEKEGMAAPAGMSLDEYGESLHKKAIECGVTLLDGMGFAPGLSNVTLGEGIRRVGAKRAVARVGGIPSREAAARHPLQYMITWSFDHVLREYMVGVRVLEDGRVSEVEATSGRESFRFKECGIDEELECAITPGMPSFLYTHSHLESFSEKTIRWPGHWQAIDTLKECGLLDIAPISYAGQDISPRDFFLRLIEPRLKPLPGDEDVCVMWNSAQGSEEQADCFMWAEADSKNGITAMARVTGSAAAIAARFLAQGRIGEKGIVAPEEAFCGELYGELYGDLLQELKRRGINIVEVIKPVESKASLDA